MPHVEMVAMLPAPWVKAGTLRTRAPAAGLTSPFSETRGWRRVKLNHHLTLGDLPNLQVR